MPNTRSLDPGSCGIQGLQISLLPALPAPNPCRIHMQDLAAALGCRVRALTHIKAEMKTNTSGLEGI